MSRYSQYWRVNRSRDEATELALGLRALRKVGQHVGRNVKPIYWKGMVEDESSHIVLEPKSIQGAYPIAHKNFDLLVAEVIHRGLASVEWTEHVTDRVMRSFPALPVDQRLFLGDLLAAAETIYIDAVADANVFHRLYLKSYWADVLSSEVRDPSLPPTSASLARVWLQQELTGPPPARLHFYYEDLLPILSEAAAAIRQVARQTPTRVRRDARVDLYRDLWDRVIKAISDWETFSADPNAVNLYDEGGPPGDLEKPEDAADGRDPEEEEQSPSNGGLSPELVEEVNAILEDEETDLTQNVAVAVQDPEARSMETLFRRGIARSSVSPDELQVKRLRRIFRRQETLIRQARRRKVRRGLTGGKLDARRLSRVPLDGRTFKDKQAPGDDNYWQICIVADASASMTGKGGTSKPWYTAEKTFVSLAEATKGFRNVLEIYAYNAERRVCNLTRLYHGGELYSVMPAGRTPSGQAILAAAMLMKKKYKKSMIIHITDGAANCGLRLAEAVDYCLKYGIDVFTIGCGCNQQTRDFLRVCFPPNRLYFMRNINYLSEGIERLFSQRVLSPIR